MIPSKDEQIISKVVESFKLFAISDIKFNKDRPIAAAILCSCLLDQISSLMYSKGKAVDKARNFIKEYLPSYSDIDLYDILRNPLVHNYSLKKNYSVTSDPALSEFGASILPYGIIYIPQFIAEFEDALERAFLTLLKTPSIRSLAIKRVSKYAVLAQGQIEVGTYTCREIDCLRDRYQLLIANHPLFANNQTIKIEIASVLFFENTFEAYLEVFDSISQKMIIRYPLHQFARWLNVISPFEFLESDSNLN